MCLLVGVIRRIPWAKRVCVVRMGVRAIWEHVRRAPLQYVLVVQFEKLKVMKAIKTRTLWSVL